MKADDAVKLGATVKAISDVVETSGRDYSESDVEAVKLGEMFGFEYILHHEYVGSRIKSFDPRVHAINIGGSAVSVIDEKVLANLPKPSAGEALIAIRGKPNPRSNGITDKRKAMVEMMGFDWHLTEDGQRFLEFLGEPSTVFYGLFTDLRKAALATSFYHMSGGAFNGKLAKPLAKHNLFVEVRGLFPADWREYTLAGKRFTSAEVAYGKWPMGNEGFVTSKAPGNAMAFIRRNGLECNVVGTLQTARGRRTGVELAEIIGSDGKSVYYSGRK
jgi:phosphoribosylaminoimidazole (AIR) synthetase